MLNTRHWSIIGYSVLSGLAIYKDIITTAESFAIVMAPLAAAFAYDKITSLRKKTG